MRADPAHADDAERPAGELDAPQGGGRRRRPPAAVVRQVQSGREREQHRQRVLRHRRRRVLRQDRQPDASACQQLDVEVVVARGVEHDPPQAREPVEQRIVQRGQADVGAADDLGAGEEPDGLVGGGRAGTCHDPHVRHRLEALPVAGGEAGTPLPADGHQDRTAHDTPLPTPVRQRAVILARPRRHLGDTGDPGGGGSLRRARSGGSIRRRRGGRGRRAGPADPAGRGSWPAGGRRSSAARPGRPVGTTAGRRGGAPCGGAG